MNYLTVLAAIALARLATVGGQVPCESSLRNLPAFSYLFTHCNCLRDDWTEWRAVNRTAVPTSQCPSGSALIYERRQEVIDGECEDIVERNVTCKCYSL